ncbi:MAG: cytochrome c3 family protein [Actinomycetota bacterium]
MDKIMGRGMYNPFNAVKCSFVSNAFSLTLGNLHQHLTITELVLARLERIRRGMRKWILKIKRRDFITIVLDLAIIVSFATSSLMFGLCIKCALPAASISEHSFGELVQLRSQYAKVFKNLEGTMTAVIYATPVHYRDDVGGWHELNPSIKNLKVTDLPFRAAFGSTTPSLTLKVDKTEVKFIPKGAKRVHGKVYKNRITYKNAFKSTDLRYKVGATYVKEEIILKESSAPHSFVFEVVSNKSIAPLKGGSLDFGNCRTVSPFAKDFEERISNVNITLKKIKGKSFLTLSVDPAWLKTATFPVIIDPTVVIQPDPIVGKDAHVDSTQPDVNFGADATLNAWIGTVTTTRSFLQFDLSSIPPKSIINSASLQLYVKSAFGGNVYVRKVASEWKEGTGAVPADGVTWNTQPSFEEILDRQLMDAADVWKSWDITTLVSDWHAGREINKGIVLLTGETGIIEGGVFYSSDYADDPTLRPKLVVDYSLPSDGIAPTSTITDPADGSHLKGIAYNITGTAQDNLGGSGIAKVQISTDGGNTWQDAAGTDIWSFSWTLPADGVYNIRSRAIDNYGNVESPGPGVSVTVDNTPPQASISQPVTDSEVSGIITIYGTATDENFGQYKLEYGATSAPTTWTLLGAVHTTPVLDNALESGYTLGISNGTYTIRLIAKDKADNVTIDAVTVVVNNPGVISTPHRNYTVDTDMCACCHRNHTAVGDNHLVREIEAELCLTCHDGMGDVTNIRDAYDSPRESRYPIKDLLFIKDPRHILECSHCHNTHGNKDALGNYYPRLLRVTDPAGNKIYQGNDFCGACHGASDLGLGYALGGDHITNFTGIAAHDVNTGYPPSGTLIKCINCHRNHGSDFPRLNRGLEEELCYTCHNSANLPNTLNNWDIQAQFSLPSHHDIISETGAKVECTSCHGPHVARAVAGAMISDPDNTKNLWTGGMIDFCLKCHNGAPPLAVTNSTTVVPHNISHPTISLELSPFFPGWNKSAFTSAGMATNALAGITCKTCHHPHGSNNARLNAFNYDNSTVYGEERLCLACHNPTTGPTIGAPDIDTLLTKAYKHPVDTVTGIHQDTENFSNLAYDPVSSKRHSECVDCHNPHKATPDGASAPAASGKIKGVGGVDTNGVPVNPIVNQYELCYKCHSTYTTLPPEQKDKAFEFDMTNPSYHPVEGVGKNTGIDLLAFVAPWTDASLVYCTDCHGTNNQTGAQCLAGSANEHILRAPYTTIDTSLCFQCHAQESYSVGDPLLSKSRWQGHRISGHQACMDCHGSHGKKQAHLINRGYDHYIGGGRIVTDSACAGVGCHDIGVWISYTNAY